MNVVSAAAESLNAMNPAARITELMYERDTLHIYEGIRIVSHGHREEAGPYVNRIIKALAIIKAIDRPRFRRVQRLRYIVNGWPPSKDAVGCYDTTVRACILDFPKLEQGHKSWKRPEAIAMVIVHEATHCQIEDRFGPASEADVEFQMRVEGICFREQARFMKRLGFRVSAEFDEWTYRQDWQRTRIERIIDGCDLISDRLPPGKRRAVLSGVGHVLRAVKRRTESAELRDKPAS